MNGFKLFNMMYVKLMKIKNCVLIKEQTNREKLKVIMKRKSYALERKKTRCYRKENFKQNDVIKSKISIKKNYYYTSRRLKKSLLLNS